MVTDRPLTEGGARYVSNSEGAPPLPPPGGYRAAQRRGTDDPQVADHRAAAAGPRRTNAIGWVSLCAAILFAFTLLVLLGIGLTDVIYGPTILALQLALIGAVVAALITARGRLLGIVALAVVLLFNVATVGGLAALRTSATGAYDGGKTDEQRLWEAYPGIKDRDPRSILNSPSLEDVRALSEDVLAEVRARLTAEYGFEWVQVTDEVLRPERNGYGGESMLVQYTSPQWMTTTPVTGYEHKRAVMTTVSEVLLEQGFWEMFAFNEPTSGISPDVIEKMYGAADPREQVVWEWYSDNYPDPTRFYADITDLANDRTGDYRAAREAQSARTGEPLEGLSLTVLADELLSVEKRDAFESALGAYDGG